MADAGGRWTRPASRPRTWRLDAARASSQVVDQGFDRNSDGRTPMSEASGHRRDSPAESMPSYVLPSCESVRCETQSAV